MFFLLVALAHWFLSDGELIWIGFSTSFAVRHGTHILFK